MKFLNKSTIRPHVGHIRIVYTFWIYFKPERGLNVDYDPPEVLLYRDFDTREGITIELKHIEPSAFLYNLQRTRNSVTQIYTRVMQMDPRSQALFNNNTTNALKFYQYQIY